MPFPQSKNRRRSDHRLKWLAGISLAALVIGGYLLYEMGRLHAGYSRFEAAAEKRDWARERDRLSDEIVLLREQVVQFETLRTTDREAYSAVEENLGSLQNKIQEQREAIAFYRGIISPSDSNSGLRIQDLQLLRGADESHYRLRLVLVQVKQHHREIYGDVRLSVDGAREGEAVSYPVSQLLAAGERRGWSYGFRYFQDFERNLKLPDGFTPLTVNIELLPKGKGNVGLKQSFPWSTSPGNG
ncbi:MAG: DUF6776 family protein [Pseudomonadota bacterium]